MGGSKWAAFYKERAHSRSYYHYFTEKYAPFLGQALRALRTAGVERVLELGAGLGSTTAVLMNVSQLYHEFHVLEKCPEMGVLLEQRFGSTVTYLRTCAVEFSPREPYGLVHSHGLLEHFEPEDVRRIIDNHRGSVQVHYVPGDRHGEPSFGDERLMPIEYWQDITHPTEAFAFNDGKDYCLVYLRGH